mmetsp:Transcript_32878/g.75189  ORF Transcript_32878/g.75189 Transcript_32878/m.75189 type:complete len:251 (+) Transcript_32878:40-792(+)
MPSPTCTPCRTRSPWCAKVRSGMHRLISARPRGDGRTSPTPAVARMSVKRGRMSRGEVRLPGTGSFVNTRMLLPALTNACPDTPSAERSRLGRGKLTAADIVVKTSPPEAPLARKWSPCFSLGPRPFVRNPLIFKPSPEKKRSLTVMAALRSESSGSSRPYASPRPRDTPGMRLGTCSCAVPACLKNRTSPPKPANSSSVRRRTPEEGTKELSRESTENVCFTLDLRVWPACGLKGWPAGTLNTLRQFSS